MHNDISSTIQTIAVMALPIIFAVVLHEVSHGYVAKRLGDDTASRMGRLTLNPIAHIDLFGTVLMPIMFYMASGFLFAYAKPVPVDFSRLRNPKRDMVWVAAAGPATNIALAIISAIVLKVLALYFPESLLVEMSEGTQELKANGVVSMIVIPLSLMLFYSTMLNVVLAVINLIPIPPADGGRIVTGLLPEPQASAYAKIEPVGMILLIIIIVFNPLGILNWTVRPLIEGLLEILL